MAKEKFLEDLGMSFPIEAVLAYQRLLSEQERLKGPLVAREFWIDRERQRNLENERLSIGFYVTFCIQMYELYEIKVSPEDVSNLVLSGLSLAEISQMLAKSAELRASAKSGKQKKDEMQLQQTQLNFDREKHRESVRARHAEIRKLPFEEQLFMWAPEDMISYIESSPMRKIYAENIYALIKSAKTMDQTVRAVEWFIEVVHADYVSADYSSLRQYIYKYLGVDNPPETIREYLKQLKEAHE